jgi:hypothetical protein
VGVEENGYYVNINNMIIIYEKSTLNKAYEIKNGRREEYKVDYKKSYNFPFEINKKWENTFRRRTTSSRRITDPEYLFHETYKVLGWEDVEVKAGKFKAIKIQYRKKNINTGWEARTWYWYSPYVKTIVKFQSDNDPSYELVSFDIKK